MHSDWTICLDSRPALRRGLRLLAAALLLAGLLWAVTVPPTVPPQLTPASVTALTPGSVAAMASPVFDYSPGWTVSALGADPQEPAEPWLTPSGVVTFSVTGQEIAFNLAVGDYWGYLYVTVDGAPANRLAHIPSNHNHVGQAAGYLTLYAPEAQTDTGPSPRWVVVHRGPRPDTTQQVRVEVWRGWGQTPLRGVAVDALPAPLRPRWPATLLLVLAVGALVLSQPRPPRSLRLSRLLIQFTRPVARQALGDGVALLGALVVAAAMLSRIWWLGPLGLALLGYAALASPLRWAAALLVGLPFYYGTTLPLLPGRVTNLVDAGVWGGVVVSLGYWLRSGRPITAPATQGWVAALAGWALVAATAATYADPALREWRTLFAAALGFAVLLAICGSEDVSPTRRLRLLVGAWLLGALLMAGIALAQAVGGFGLIEAEGVYRVRGLYGSPNNLALYLERALFLPLAGVMLLPRSRWCWLLLAMTAILGAALLLTFSKGALLLGLPAGLATLWLGGLVLLRRAGRRPRGLWWLAAAATAILLTLLPFAGTERFQRLLDFETGTGMIRLLLWRSAWQMALDHAWLGVGPDNFLYVFRSGYLLPAAWQEPDLNHPHNLVLDWWTRLGLPGLLLGMGWMTTGVWGLARQVREALCSAQGDEGAVMLSAAPLLRPAGQQSLTPSAALWLGILAGAVAALAHGLIDLSYAVPDLTLVWVLFFSLPDLADRDVSLRSP